mmetsp:Transcript_29488/g.57810  ORF Transcript_29488/g.57810 Transcript_29488/m.57810 type:complete len:251 (+) Transcript_29488:83-835(+)
MSAKDGSSLRGCLYCCGFCCLVTVALLVFGLPIFVNWVIKNSSLSTSGTVTDTQILPTGQLRAKWALDWKLDLPLVGPLTMETNSEKSFNPTPHYMDTTLRFLNPTPVPIWLHPTNVSLSGPEIDGHRDLAEMRTGTVAFPSGISDTSFKTWIQIHSIERAERTLSEAIASGSGGNVVIHMDGAVTVLLISRVQFDVGKKMRCIATAIPAPRRTLLLRRSTNSVLSPDGGHETPVKHQNVKVKCSYRGNV